jgi:uncharacterized protein involved in exopolysaccharide biosynthesis
MTSENRIVESNLSAPRQATLRDLVAVVFRQKWVVLTVFAVTTLSVFVLNLGTATTYESNSQLRVERGRRENTLNPTPRVLPWNEEISSEIETVKSYPVAHRAQEILDQWYKEGKISRPIRLNRGGIGAGVLGESNVIDVSYESQDASVCRPATDAITTAYAEFRRQSQSFPAAASFFLVELDRVSTELAEAQAGKEAYLGQLGPTGSRARQTSVSLLLQDTDMKFLSKSNDVSLLRQQAATARSLLNAGEIESPYFTELGNENTTTINELRRQLMENRLQRDQLAATLTDQHPKFRAAEQAFQSAHGMLEREIRRTADLLDARLSEGEAGLRDLDGQRNLLRAELTQFPQVEVELARRDNQISLLQDKLKDLRQKQLLTQVNEATAPDYTVTILSPADAPAAKNTRDYVRMALAPLMSVVVGLLLAFFLDSLDHSLRGPADVEEHLGLPVLAALPESND